MKLESKILILLCLLLAQGAGFAQNKIYMVSVGIADYPGKGDLNLPVNDAITMRDLYRDKANASTAILTDKKATIANIENTILTMFAKAGENDEVVLFFSGHGNPAGFLAYDGVLTHATVRQLFAKCKAKQKIVFADACYAGKMRINKKFDDTKKSKSEVMLFLASRTNEKSIEMTIMHNGFFTLCLKKGLLGEADANGDKVVTAHELFNYVSVKVQKISDGKQHPVMWGKFDDNMPIMRLGIKTTQAI
ncbi:MAG: caspase family protein [Muribaculaceae bacterium]|jgi:uncharacterized caspase-like protein|nr:caspase family protein [Muribaculaceae bacterium]